MVSGDALLPSHFVCLWLGPPRNWREQNDRDYDYDPSRPRYPQDGGGPRRIEYKRSRSSSAAQEDNGHGKK